MNWAEMSSKEVTTMMVTLSDNQVTNSSGISMTPLDIAYVTVTAAMSLMSIFGSLVVLFVHWSYADLRTSGRTMLVHLTVADLLTALGNLMGVTWYLSIETLEYKMAYCKFHSALTIMSSIASFFWTVVIAWFVFWILIRMQPTVNQRGQSLSDIILAVVCWGVPIIIAVTALALDVLGYDHNLSQASWCWIDPEASNGMMWALVTGKAWELAACILTVSLYAAVKVMLFKQAKRRSTLMGRTNRRMEEANTKLTFVPLVFIVIRIWGTIRFLLGNFAHDYASSSDSDWIVILQGTGDSAQGFANFVMYIFFTSKIRERLFQNCPCHCSESGSIASPKSSRNHGDTSQHEPSVGTLKPSNKIQPDLTGHVSEPDSRHVSTIESHKTAQVYGQDESGASATATCWTKPPETVTQHMDTDASGVADIKTIHI
ncbi:unnamed protein product [Lymnaea stagnalis]|uniref:G-protein coupled receptors family 2 profile 2 domain-containing protein n=1 Tax=Lymnaea stagnalis TaxID=6523 RepID=A0AAV2HX68_LYMST